VKRKPTPSYVLHKQSGRGRLTWTDTAGIRQQKLLPGAFNSPESLVAKARLELEIATSATATAPGTPNSNISVAEVLNAYLEHAKQHYRRSDGTPTSEVREYKIAIRYVRELYGETRAANFGPLAMKAVREKFVGERWCRKTINQRVGRVKRMFKWAVAEELVPPAVHQALTAVGGLQRGRTEAHETDPVEPVDDATVDATLPHLNRHVAGLVELQRLTGCRPGEACTIRRADTDTGGTIWLYKPAHHKTAWRGKTRVITIGPRAQEMLKQFFTPDINDYLFSPRRAMAEYQAERAANRQTPRYPGHMARNAAKRKTHPKRTPQEMYDVTSYAHAVKRACLKAKVAHWHPNQLRHTFATRVRKQHGLEAAQVLLGHSRADVTQVYAERNEALAATVVAKIG
jgi:integrase